MKWVNFCPPVALVLTLRRLKSDRWEEEFAWVSLISNNREITRLCLLYGSLAMWTAVTRARIPVNDANGLIRRASVSRTHGCFLTVSMNRSISIVRRGCKWPKQAEKWLFHAGWLTRLQRATSFSRGSWKTMLQNKNEWLSSDFGWEIDMTCYCPVSHLVYSVIFRE